MPDLKPLLSPDSVAIIGASADLETLRGRLTHALIGHGYDGRVFPVTRSQNEVLGLRAYPSVAALPEPVDLAIILVPAAHVVETVSLTATSDAPLLAWASARDAGMTWPAWRRRWPSGCRYLTPRRCGCR